MKLTAEITELLTQLVDIESIENPQFLDGNATSLCQHLLDLYGKTNNQDSHDLIIKIIDRSGYSIFSPRPNVQLRCSATYDESARLGGNVNSGEGLELSEEQFMNLLPINGYFH